MEPSLAGEQVLLLWGLFDTELYVEFGGERFGPYQPVSGPIPLGRYRAFKRSKSMERADRIRQLAGQVGVPIAALSGEDVQLVKSIDAGDEVIPSQPFDAQVMEAHFPNGVTAKLAIADDLGLPLSKLVAEDKAFIEQVLAETLIRRVVLERVRSYFREKASHAD